MMLKTAPIAAVLPAKDIQRAKKFYQSKLGLQASNLPVPEDSVYFECGDGTMLYIYKKEGGTKADHTAALWLVNDVEETVEELSHKGVIFEIYDLPSLKTDERGIAEMGGAKGAWFKDSEGNILAITETPD